jgi:hypothetical protein
MPRQISDEEYAYLQQKRQTADFAESVFNDPALNNEAKALIKRKYPNMKIADYDIENRVNARIDEFEKGKREEEEAKRIEADDRKYQETRSGIKKQYGFTDDAMKKLEDMMVERNIGDYEVAASFFAAKNPPTSEPGYDPTRWHHEKTDQFKEIAADPEAWGRNEILQAIRRDEAKTKNGWR